MVVISRRIACCGYCGEMDHGKINAELTVLRELMGFVNRQVGVYCDCLSGLLGNKVRIERLDARVQRSHQPAHCGRAACYHLGKSRKALACSRSPRLLLLRFSFGASIEHAPERGRAPARL